MEGFALILIGAAIFSHAWYLLGLYSDGRTVGILMAALALALLSTLTFDPQLLGLQGADGAQKLGEVTMMKTLIVLWAAYAGAVLPDSVAPGVEQVRASVSAALREALIEDAGVDVLLAYADTDEGAEDAEVLRLCLEMLPARSPKRAGLVARLDRLTP